MLAVISDIHSNTEALRAVLDDITDRGIERIVCLGDVIGYGPEPRECLDLVRERAEVCLMGNHDFAVMYEPENFNAGAEAAAFWTRQQLEADPDDAACRERWEFLGSLQIKHRLVEESLESGPIAFVRGTLEVGQVMAPPVIKAVKLSAPPADITFIDAPPGTSCPVIESVRDCDFVLLVTEPTPFGLNDLKLAVDLVRILQLPFGVVINRADIGDDRTELYCQQEQIAVLGRIPDDRRIAEAYSRGELVSLAVPACEQLFKQIFDAIIQHVEVCL